VLLFPGLARLLRGRTVPGGHEPALVAAERRALERLDPRATLAADRERVGQLLDRASRAVSERIGRDRRTVEREAGRLGPFVATRVALGRAALAAAAAGLAALGPQATLDRGYAIVRRLVDDRVVRSPEDVDVGTDLRVTVAEGDFTARRTAGGGPR